MAHEQKIYDVPLENPANVAPWHGVNTINPTEHDVIFDINPEKKIDVTQVELKPLVENIENEPEIDVARSKQKQPNIVYPLIILLSSLIIVKTFAK